MKLTNFTREYEYVFTFNFEKGINKTVDISNLIKNKVKKDELETAHLDKDWGCLEFKNGMVDIEPNTLYKFTQGK